MADEQQQSRKIPCSDCTYFNGNDLCSFINQPTTPDTSCFVELYEKLPLCGDNKTCETCQYLSNPCIGDRKNPVTQLKINPHWGQIRTLNTKSRVCFISAGRQSGKTAWGPIWMYYKMQKCGDGDYLAVSPSFPLQDKKLIPVYIQFFEKTLGIGHLKAAKKIMEIDGNGLHAQIFFGSAKNAASLESATALAAHLDEAGQDDFTWAAWDAVLGRLSRSRGDILITTTLYNLNDWLKKEVYIPWKNGDPDYDVVQFESIQCPGFSIKEFNWLRQRMPSWRFDMEYRGIYSIPSGLIYPDFTDAHIIKSFPIPDKWNWHVAIDPGAVHTGIGWFAEEPGTRKYYLVRSYLDGNKTTKMHVQKAMRYPEFGRVKRWVGGAGSEDQFRMDWQAEGIHIREPEIRDVESGIDKVTALFKENRFFIFDTPENQWVIDELHTYSRELDEQNDPTEYIKDKNKFHACDFIRYFASGTASQFNSARLLAIVSRHGRGRWRGHSEN